MALNDDEKSNQIYKKTRLIKYILNSNKSLFAHDKNAFNTVKIKINTIFKTMNPKQIEFVLDNPHVAQTIFLDKCTENCKIGVMKFTRIMDENLPRLPYYDRSKEITTNVHKGQLKLLMSEIEFLTQYGNTTKHVLYVGSAPGYHIPCLAELFSQHIFYMYDPAFKDISHFNQLIQQKRAFIYPQYFTEKTVQEFQQTHKVDKVLLVSDIRRDMGDQTDFDYMNKIVIEDMELQRQIVKMINPIAAILKFRLPWLDKDIEYFDGTRYFGVYARTYSTETRLVVDNINSTKIYNGKVSEEELFHFNVIQRPSLYKHPKVFIERIDHCYDCTAEIYIMQTYLKYAYKQHFNHKKLNHIITMIENRVNATKKGNLTNELPFNKDFDYKIKNQLKNIKSTDVEPNLTELPDLSTIIYFVDSYTRVFH